jgi:hypothetical protein
MHYMHRWLGIVLFTASNAWAQDLPVGPVLFSLGADQSETMKEIKSHFEVVNAPGQPNTFVLWEGKRPNLRAVGIVAFQNSRLNWAQRNWGSFEGKVDSIEVSKALFSAVESAAATSGASATISTKTRRVPGNDFRTIAFDFPGRKVTMTSSEGDATHGGKQVSIDESIRAQ